MIDALAFTALSAVTAPVPCVILSLPSRSDVPWPSSARCRFALASAPASQPFQIFSP
jgi:hypothetical protein